MRRVLLSDRQIDALVVSAHSVMDGRLAAEDEACLEEAIRALKDAFYVTDSPSSRELDLRRAGTAA